jgi:hypothetical protein
MPDNSVNASPTKRFFVEMLTRDIEIPDAILDLLDNCVDGILRSNKIKQLQGDVIDDEKPYAGYSASIEFSQAHFGIQDNCGGISQEIAQKYAFMMGRSEETRDEDLPTVGMYGIGMKRAIFKLGRKCSVKSFTPEGAFEISISPEWMLSDNWTLQLNAIDNITEYGTHILVTELSPNIAEYFDPENSIYDLLPKVIAQHYSFIIKKGFSVFVNGSEIIPRELSLLISEDGELLTNSITPYLYSATIENVNIFLAVGFYKPMIEEDELEEEAKSKRSSEDAGWTIVCNDRVVLYNDRSILTGWGEADVPSYHTQFIGISGIVFFNSTHPENLPLTTTKRGVDGSSKLYLRVKNSMREGLKKFTSYTNDWKKFNEEQKQISAHARARDIIEISKIQVTDSWKTVANSPNEHKLNLPLAKPKNLETDPMRQIKYNKRQSEIDKVKHYFFEEDQQVKPSDIGIQCFDHFLNS